MRVLLARRLPNILRDDQLTSILVGRQLPIQLFLIPFNRSRQSRLRQIPSARYYHDNSQLPVIDMVMVFGMENAGEHRHLLVKSFGYLNNISFM